MANRGLLIVRYDEKSLHAIEQSLRGLPGAMGKIMPAAINRSLSTMRVQIARRIKATGLRLPINRIKAGMTMHRASASLWSGSLTMSTRSYDLASDFHARQTRGGVVVRVQKTTVHLPQAFIPQGERKAAWWGWNTVLMRRPTAGSGMTWRTARERHSLVGRMPVVKVWGPTLAQLWGQATEIHGAVVKEADAVLGKEIKSKIRWVLKIPGK